jgi:hypothetical protein
VDDDLHPAAVTPAARGSSFDMQVPDAVPKLAHETLEGHEKLSGLAPVMGSNGGASGTGTMPGRTSVIAAS